MPPVLRLTPVDWGCTVPPPPQRVVLTPRCDGARSLEGCTGAHRPGGDRRQPASGRCSRGRALCRPPGCRRCPHWSAPRISDSRTALQRTVRSSSGWPTGRLSSGRSPCAGTSPATAPVGGRHERQRKTGLLRLVAEQAARRLGPGELHLYAVDGGSGDSEDCRCSLTPGQSCPGTTTPGSSDWCAGSPLR